MLLEMTGGIRFNATLYTFPDGKPDSERTFATMLLQKAKFGDSPIKLNYSRKARIAGATRAISYKPSKCPPSVSSSTH